MHERLSSEGPVVMHGLSASPEISVVYLARKPDGCVPIKNFLASYEKFPAGRAHHLVVVCKGYGRSDRIEFPPPHTKLFINDFGFDIRAYRLAAEYSDSKYLCFLNTFSEILVPGWLDKLFAVAKRADVGVAGTTGSWESMYSNALADTAGRGGVQSWLRCFGCKVSFDPFPNPHLRTNAFLIHRELMLQVWPRFALTKRGAYLFENGRHNFTKRIIRLGLKVMVVGKDGIGYEKEDWAASKTFRAGDQKNLLIADNQTRLFRAADTRTRRWLAFRAWGGQPE